MKPIIFSILHMSCAGLVSYHLITGGWLTNRYRLDDWNIVNLLIAIFEIFAVGAVIAYWLSRSALSYVCVKRLLLGQLIIAVAALLFFLFFMMTWHPRMM